MTHPNGAGGARARARAAMTADILDAARRQLADVGSAGLSLRAVARELGLASSAVYRYFPSRDDLLTALILEAYDDLGDAVDAALEPIPAGGHLRRWMACAAATRDWAAARPHQWALIFGSPVPGYRAPADTVDPAARVPLALLGIVAEAAAGGCLEPADARGLDPGDEPSRLAAATARIEELRAALPMLPGGVSDAAAMRAAMGWIHLVGAISMELFGHLSNVVPDYRAWFELQMRIVGRDLGLPAMDQILPGH